jgi:hypothetical protein
MGKEKKHRGKQPKVDPKDKDVFSDKDVSAAEETTEDKQARSSSSCLIIKKQPAHSSPVKPPPPSGNLLLSILPKTSITKKGKNEIKGSESKNSPSPVSSEEPALDTSLDKNVKEDKKTAEAKPGTSPTFSTPSSEEASLLSDFLGNNNGIANEEEIKEKLTPSSDVLEGFSPFIA